MAPLWFFLAGLPASLLLERAMAFLSQPEAVDEPEAEAPKPGLTPSVRRLPWQVGLWPDRVRWTVVAAAPLLMAVAGWRFDAVSAAAVSLLVLAMLLCMGTDLIQFRVPNVVTYPGIVVALVAAAVLPGGKPLSALLATVVFGGALFILAVLTRGGLGLGDVKLGMLMGAGLGLSAAYQAVVLGVIAGGVVILALFLLGVVSRRQAVPYAPFLAAAAVAVVLLRGAAFAPL